jgi:carbon monoxide dehydrogenase subunit G
MESTFESRVGSVHKSDESIYNFLTNFNNFKKFLTPEKLDKFESTEESCKFTIPGIGEIGLRIIEKEPFKTIKVAGEGMANQKFILWIQLKQIAENDTKVKLTLKSDINPMLKMMVSKPIQDFLNKLVDSIENIPL